MRERDLSNRDFRLDRSRMMESSFLLAALTDRVYESDADGSYLIWSLGWVEVACFYRKILTRRTPARYAVHVAIESLQTVDLNSLGKIKVLDEVRVQCFDGTECGRTCRSDPNPMLRLVRLPTFLIAYRGHFPSFFFLTDPHDLWLVPPGIGRYG